LGRILKSGDSNHMYVFFLKRIKISTYQAYLKELFRSFI
jgi:hypothetical protein